jgi:alginate O-acetyltransferase complex protein AlgI
MLFNSLVFVAFFAVVYPAYVLLQGRLRLQNLLLLAGSLLFYGWWDWRFLVLLIVTSTVHFAVAAAIHERPDEVARKRLITGAVAMDLVVLGFFKYFGFFVDSAERAVATVGWDVSGPALQIVLPVGISFYTFQTMSYTIDVYRRELKPTRDYLDFLLFVTFFPQLVAGPIERATALLPQVQLPRRITLEGVEAGVWLVLWGAFKKVVIADNIALVANEIFNEHEQYHGLDLFLGTLAFTVQIYGDFSGYTDIARGIAKLMGFELMLNFRLPYFAVSPSDFWQRWHISLSSWLRDYLYIPLGGNRGGEWRTARNLWLTMLLGGLWHGAAWNFVAWGAYHGLILVFFRWFAPRDPTWRGEPVRYVAQVGLMFALTMAGWVLFRCDSPAQIAHFFTGMSWVPSAHSAGFARTIAAFSLPLLVVQIAQHATGDLLVMPKLRLREPVYAACFVALVLFGVDEAVEFIYFQF